MRGKSTFIGRHGERAALSGLLDRAAGGRGGSVAILGEAGVGKSALVDHMVGAGPAGMSVLRVTGVEVESDLAYAALATLMSQAGTALHELDHRSADALHGAIGVGDATPPGLGVHMATLALVTFLAAREPVLLVVDDAQWIDAASLGLVTFVARRVAHDAVAVVLVGRPAGDLEPMLAGIERLTLGPLTAHEAVVLMAGHDVVAPVAAECWSATGGNPLALVELAAALGPDERNGLAPLPDPIPVAGPIRAVFAHRLGALDAAACGALAIVAVEASGDTAVVARALAAARIDATDLRAAERAGFVHVDGGTLSWEHPLARAAVLDTIDAPTRRAAHRAVAAALSPGDDRGRLVFHLAAAADGPDDEVADRLEGVARTSTERGALRAAAVAWDAAAELSVDDAGRAERRLQALEARWLAAETETVLRTGRPQVEAETDPARRARLAVLVGQAVLWWDGPHAGARYLTTEGDRVVATDPALGGFLYLYAAQSHLLALEPRAVVELAGRARDRGMAVADAGVAFMAQAFEGLGRLLLGEVATAQALLAPLADLCPGLLEAQVEGASAMAQVLSFGQVAAEQWDEARLLMAGIISEGERTGHIGMTVLAHDQLAELEWRQGRWAEAAARISHALTLAEGQDQDQPLVQQGRLRLARIDAGRGRTDLARPVAEAALALGQRCGWGSLVIWAHEVLALAALADDDAGAALRHLDALAVLTADRGVRHPGVLWWQAAHVETLAAQGRTAEARTALARLRSDHAAAGTRWSAAAVARGEAALAIDAAVAVARLDVAVEALTELGAGFELALALLARGRRHRDLAEAGAVSRNAATAHAAVARGLAGTHEAAPDLADAHGVASRDLAEAQARFANLDARPWAERAARLAGPAGPPPPPSLAGTLTDAEMRVALAVGAGATNREAASRLFLSVKTVDSHLQSIYRRLAIRSRSQLAALVARELGPTV